MDFNEEGELVLKATGWDKLFIPPPLESKYDITGQTSQVITFSLGTNETVQSEPGTMMYMSSGVDPHVTYEGCFGRACSGECCYAVNYTNSGSSENTSYLSLTPNFPTMKVVPVDLSSPDVNGKLIAQQGAFMASYGDVEVNVSFDCSCTALCAGTGLVRQKLKGSGTAFLAATGTIVQKVLAEGEIILADTNCILAFAKSVSIDVRKSGSIVGMFGGGEGIFNTVLKGPGLVLIQSMNEVTFKKSMQADKIWRR